MLNYSQAIESWRESITKINGDIYDFKVIKPMVDTWIEQNIVIPDSTSVYPGPYSFNLTPYMREIVNCLHPTNPVRFVSIMKDGQSGFTTALVVGGLCYIISEIPEGILFTASDINLATKTITERLDPVIRSSRLEYLIRPNVIKRTNNATGDTAKKKEFAGGTLTSAGTNSANTFRMFSAKYIFADDYDTAPKEVGKEGSPKMVMKTRQNSYGDKAKTFMISTPTITQTSNIYEEYLLGTQEKWNWPCPHCGEYFPVEWQYKNDDNTYSGVVWELNEEKKLIIDSVKYKTPCCGGIILEKQKYDLNLLGKWVATVEPIEARYRSFQKNSIINPPGFDGWVTLVQEWLAANPYGQKPIVKFLKVFNNLRLGLPFAESGDVPKVNDLMQNTRGYLPGVIPDKTCEEDGNGVIVLISLAVDINGTMEMDNEDVRLDWEILAHSQTGATYSVDHGSIGTFKRVHTKSKKEKELDFDREKWTLTHEVKNSVWPELQKLILEPLKSESGTERKITISLIDTGFGEKAAMQFIKNFTGAFVFGVKGRTETGNGYRKLGRDANPIMRGKEHPKHLYIVDVNQTKDDLSRNMRLREGQDGYQPSGFMNYPQPNGGKYDMKNYFSHYEGEVRLEEKNKNDEVIAYIWKKKGNQSANHFWDVRVYNQVAPLIYLDLIKRSDERYRNLTWEDFVQLIVE